MKLTENQYAALRQMARHTICINFPESTYSDKDRWWLQAVHWHGGYGISYADLRKLYERGAIHMKKRERGYGGIEVTDYAITEETFKAVIQDMKKEKLGETYEIF